MLKYFKMIKEKKGKIYSLLLVLTTLIVCGFVFFLFVSESSANAPKLTIPNELSEFYNQEDSFNFYAKESAKIYSLNAFSELVDGFQFAGRNCKIEGEYIEFCSVADTKDVEDNFKKYFSGDFQNAIKKYPYGEFSSIIYAANIKNNLLEFKADKKQRETSIGGFSVKREFDPSFLVNLDDLKIIFNFNGLYNLASKCKSKSSETEIKDCMKFNEYEIDAKINGNKIFFDISSPFFNIKNEKGIIIFNKITLKFYVVK